jgi:hypothetical protein
MIYNAFRLHDLVTIGRYFLGDFTFSHTMKNIFDNNNTSSTTSAKEHNNISFYKGELLNEGHQINDKTNDVERIEVSPLYPKDHEYPIHRSSSTNEKEI